jgi:hypothetical protein
VPKLGAGNRGIVMRFPAGVTCLCCKNAQTGCAAHPASDSVGSRGRGALSQGVNRPGREVDYLSSSLGNRTSWLMLIILILHNIRLFICQLHIN